jgi:hypothetical protein
LNDGANPLVEVRFGDLTSRLKDHYDIWVLSRTFPFSKARLLLAINATFRRRGAVLPSSIPIALTPTFAARPDKQAQWDAFLRRTAPVFRPPSFAEVIAELRGFLEPVILVRGETETANGQWTPLVGWA